MTIFFARVKPLDSIARRQTPVIDKRQKKSQKRVILLGTDSQIFWKDEKRWVQANRRRLLVATEMIKSHDFYRAFNFLKMWFLLVNTFW